MNKIKSSLSICIIIVYIFGLLGCTNIENAENSVFPSDMEKLSEMDTKNKENNSISKDKDSSTGELIQKKEYSDNVYTEDDNRNISNSVTSIRDTNMKKEYDENLCINEEELLLSFKIQNSEKRLSVCLSKENSEYIVYRFGTKDKIELEFPRDKAGSWDKFTYSYFLRGGGKVNDGMDLKYLSFENDGYQYKIYQEYTAVDNIMKVGVRVTEQATNKETDIKGQINTLKGSLISLRENTKIKIEDL